MASQSISELELKAVEHVLQELVGASGVKYARKLVKRGDAAWHANEQARHAWGLVSTKNTESGIAYIIVWLNSKSAVVSDDFDREDVK